MIRIINFTCVVLEVWADINELCFKPSLHNKSTGIDMNVKNTVQRIHHTIIQVYLLPYKIYLGFVLSFTSFGEEPFTDTLVASTNTFFLLFTVSPGRE